MNGSMHDVLLLQTSMEREVHTMKKILLIDDDADLVAVNEKRLTDAGFSVISAYDGEKGKEMARSEAPDAIILDVMMTTPDEGFDVARSLRNDARTKHTPIIMLTGINVSEFQLPKALGDYDKDSTWNPVDVFLNKPVSADTLLKKLDEIL